MRPHNEKVHQKHLSFWPTHRGLCQRASNSAGRRYPPRLPSPPRTEAGLRSLLERLTAGVPTSPGQYPLQITTKNPIPSRGLCSSQAFCGVGSTGTGQLWPGRLPPRVNRVPGLPSGRTCRTSPRRHFLLLLLSIGPLSETGIVHQCLRVEWTEQAWGPLLRAVCTQALESVQRLEPSKADSGRGWR